MKKCKIDESLSFNKSKITGSGGKTKISMSSFLRILPEEGR